MPSPDLQQAMQLALQHHRAGRLAEAGALYRRVLEIAPENPDALHLLGLIELQSGNPRAALERLEKAARLASSRADILSDLGAAYRQLGRLAEAERAHRAAISLEPQRIEAHNNLGNALRDLGRRDEAERSYRQALALQPAYFQAQKNLGGVLADLRRLEEAAAAYRQARTLKPEDVETCVSLGNVLGELRRPTEAADSYREALRLDPRCAEAYFRLGNLLREHRKLPEAERAYARALEIKPDQVGVHNNLGDVLRESGKLEQAEQVYRRALALQPDAAPLHSNLGNVLKDLGRIEEAAQSYRRALALDPRRPEVHSNLIFALDLLPDVGAKEQQAERRRWHEQHAARYAEAARPFGNLPDPARKLRIGYVSADFRRHSAYNAFSPVLLHHDRSSFHVTCYSAVVAEDEATAQLRGAVDAWCPITAMTDEALAERIRGDAIDILVDLSGHSAGNRLLVFARKPAPVQLTGWGHATGTGLAAMDYFLADAICVPKRERGYYAETVLDLPCLIGYQAPPYLPEVAPLPAPAAGIFTFGCINRIEKVSAEAMALWSRILAAVPGARLLLKDRGLDDAPLKADVLRRLGQAGIAPQRVRLAGRSSHFEHLKMYHQVDLALDPFPHGGGVSTFESLAMGVPTVTLTGSSPPGRVSASILAALDMREFVARTPADYARLAARLAQDLPGLSRLRRELRARLMRSEIGDGARYARAAEAAYRFAWQRWCKQAKPAAPRKRKRRS